MKFKWFRKSDGAPTKSAAVFFGGFACDERLLDALELPNTDVCFVYDYRDAVFAADFSQYAQLYVAAWSLGVKVADVVCADMPNVKIRTAICGTPTPVDAERGIPPEIFDATLSGFDAQAFKKFLRRICGDVPENAELMCPRTPGECADELRFLSEFSAANPEPKSRWDYAFGCSSDRIFSVSALEKSFENVSVWEGAHLNPKLFSYALSIPHTGGRFSDAFKRAAPRYNKRSVVQKNVALFLREKLCALFPERHFNRAFEFGCGTGFLSTQIKKHIVCGEFVLNDLSLGLCAEAAQSLGGSFCAGPVAEVDIGGSPDLILSASSLQWIPDRARLYKKLYKAAAKNAVIALGSFGPDNFAEFAKFGYSPAVYDTFDEFCSQVSAAGFKIVLSGEDKFSFLFKSPAEVLRHVRDTGVNGATSEFWTPHRLRSFSGAYSALFSDCGGVRLTYNPMYIIAVKE